jgi:hypothetical protein
MSSEISLSDIRKRWNEVLDLLESRDRIVWIAYFDARLAGLNNGRLTLDFSDANKLATGHNYQEARIRHRHALQSAIFDVFGLEIVVVEE